MGTYSIDVQTVSIGLLLVRIVVGLIMAAHGASKLWGWFGGYGLRGTGQFFEQLGFHPGAAFAAAASVSEIVSGLLVAIGFLGPIGPALMISVMIVAAITVHLGQGLLAPKGLEMPLLYGAAAFGLALTGFGEYSLDGLLGVAGRWSVGFTWIVLLLGIAGAFVNLAFRRRPTTVSA
ncbi:MAG TPA: DoxX family protein [Gemmatimonadaceae bacterium]|jgi:putative oxidoreductase|nr:DoxX family protein [Gemmatimonadaceae bacterium]